jgi:dCTP deaminase
MILSAQSIRRLCMPSGYYLGINHKLVEPFVERGVHEPSGKSFGLSSAGYDIRALNFSELSMDDNFSVQGDPKNVITLSASHNFVLACSMEKICMPNDLIGFVKDKSSWARKGLAVQNTVLEPGWEGYITLELSYHRNHGHITIESGTPIAQVIFQKLDNPTEQPYKGKYQDQPAQPIAARKEAIHE